jgi:hypothetical protein
VDAATGLFFELTKMGFEDHVVKGFIAGHPKKSFLGEFWASRHQGPSVHVRNGVAVHPLGVAFTQVFSFWLGCCGQWTTEERNSLKLRFSEYVLKPYFASQPSTASEYGAVQFLGCLLVIDTCSVVWLQYSQSCRGVLRTDDHGIH